MVNKNKRKRSPKVKVNKEKKNSEKKESKSKIKTVKRRNNNFLNKIQVPLSNRFNIFDEEENITDAAPTASKIAPIVVTDANIHTQQFVSNLGFDVDVKLVSIGEKIFPRSADEKKKITVALKAQNINFFSHPDNEIKIFKAILSGLPEISTTEFAESLKTKYDIDVVKIIMFKINASNKLYLCHFNKRNVDMKVLNGSDRVCQHRIKWQPYKPSNNRPTQCYRCCMYGHGASSCMRYCVCILCSGNHLIKDCNTASALGENPVYKCLNCASANIPHNHKAKSVPAKIRNNERGSTKQKQKKYISNKPHTLKQHRCCPHQ